MAKVHVDLTQVEDTGFAYIEPGQYVAEIVKIEEKLSKSSLNMLAITFKADGGKLIASHVMLEGKGAFKFKELYNAIANKEALKAGEKKDIDTARLIGQKVGVTIQDNEYNGEVRSQVAQFISKDIILTDTTTTHNEIETPVDTPEEGFVADIDW